jgi:hypothetical protein
MDIFAQAPEVREAEVISLDRIRAQLLPTRIVHPGDPRPRIPFQHPEEKIRAAADLHMADGVLAVVEELVGRLQIGQRPLEPKERARLIRASAALLSQPEGP